jgi:phosphoglycerate dehydrogenase-like enzyme
MTEPLRLLASPKFHAVLREPVAQILGARPLVFAELGDDADIAFVTRDITGMSTKHQVFPETQAFYDAMTAASSLRWVHAHSAGADRAIYQELKARGVLITSSAGANANNVAQTALAAIFGLARHFPEFHDAQRDHRWVPFKMEKPPRDLDGQTATIVGWGAIGQSIARVLAGFGMKIVVARHRDEEVAKAEATVKYDRLGDVLPRTDWLILACPLTDVTHGLVDAQALAALPATSYVINVARGEVLHEAALVDAVRNRRLAGAHLDVFQQEPLPADSPLWDLPGVVVTPHCAGHSDGNARRIRGIFLANLECWLAGKPLRNVA